ncbi:hypothetical protein P3T26_006548 [Streptomyces sp. MAA16]|nr:hypothetical protein [Streptomyces sp. MAA16]
MLLDEEPPDDFESEEDDEDEDDDVDDDVEDDEDDVDEDPDPVGVLLVDGALLDEEPRLSLR